MTTDTERRLRDLISTYANADRGPDDPFGEQAGRLHEVAAELSAVLDAAQARADAIVRWQETTGIAGEHPDDDTTASDSLLPPAGFAPAGPWMPYAAVGSLRCWRRPLRRVE